LLTPHKFVPKLIGVGNKGLIDLGGNTLNEISTLSKGAQITLLSDKHKEQIGDETVILVAGTLSMKSEAASIIIEKLAAYCHTAKVRLFLHNSLRKIPNLHQDLRELEGQKHQSVVFQERGRDQDQETEKEVNYQ